MAWKHYIWDFDGTLFCSYPHMAWAFQQALRDCGLEVPADEVMKWLKLSVTAAVNHFEPQCPDCRKGALSGAYHRHESEEDPTHPVRPYPGMEKVCRAVSGGGGFHYLYTHRGKSALEHMERFGLLPFFRDFITSEDAFPSKPAPDAIRHLVQKFRMEPDSAVMIGDRDIDLLAARNAGIHECLFDPDGYYGSFQAECRAKSVEELRRCLTKAAR